MLLGSEIPGLSANPEVGHIQFVTSQLPGIRFDPDKAGWVQRGLNKVDPQVL